MDRRARGDEPLGISRGDELLEKPLEKPLEPEISRGCELLENELLEPEPLEPGVSRGYEPLEPPQQIPTETPTITKPSSRVLRLYGTMQRWADAGWANSVVFGWGLLQGTFVPGFADVLFVPLALAKPQLAYRLAFAAAAGTIIGSIALYWTGALAFAQLSGPLASWLGVGATEMSRMHELLDRYGWLAIFASTLSPISTKLTSVASGAFEVPFVAFFAALSAGRLTRVFLIAYLVQHGGAKHFARWLKVPE